jgi:Ser/Thr protein kinase RdoA (MazF antagonist)
MRKRSAVRERILGEYARLQRDTASRTADLLRIGCHDRRLPVLSEQIASLLAFADTRPDLTDEEKAHLHAIVPRLQEQIVELLASPLPATIAHGDLHIGNVAVRPDGTPVFFDWTDACITHPFLDMITIFQQTDEALKARLRNAYLAEWSGYDTPERLRTTFALAAPLSALHQAVSYQGILQYGPPETAKELGESLPYWLRCVLQWQTEAHG